MKAALLFRTATVSLCLLCEIGGAFGEPPSEAGRAASQKAGRHRAASGGTVNGEDPYEYLSRVSGGLYFKVPSAAAGGTAMKIALNHGMADNTVALYDGNAPSTYSIPVDASITRLQIVLNTWTASQNTVHIRKPSGAVVDAATPGVSLTTLGSNVLYTVERPALATGNWTARVGGSGKYRVSVAADTSNQLDYSGDTSTGVGGTLNMTATVTQPVPQIAFGLVTADGATTLPLSLYDDGLHNDGFKDDSFYAGKQVMTSAGAYRFRVTGAGFFQRMYPILIEAGGAEVISPGHGDVPPTDLPEILQ